MRKEIENCSKCGKEVLLINGNGRCKCGFKYIEHPTKEIIVYFDPNDPPEKISEDILKGTIEGVTTHLLDELINLGAISKKERKILEKQLKSYQ